MDLLELGELAWNGQLDTTFEHHPVSSWYEGSTEIGENLLAIKGVAGFYTIDTGAGLVMLDAGTTMDIERAYQEIRKWRPNVPLMAAIYTHHHVDHVFSTQLFDDESEKNNWPRPIVYSHSLIPAHFDRYKKTGGWNTAINRRQFAHLAGNSTFKWPNQFRYPDVVFNDNLTFQLGSMTFQLTHARGETDDHTWIHIPEERMLITGDLFIWAVPNGGNPQKVQRYISDWADALEKMDGLNCEILLPGHGFPIVGSERVSEALSSTALFLRDIEAQTLNLMNKGWPLLKIVHSIKFNEDLLSKPWLKPVYDDPTFLVRMIWRRYGGWWDGEFDRLIPDSRENEANEWITLVGDEQKVIDRAIQLSKDGKHALAANLIETLFYSNRDSSEIHEARSMIYQGFSSIQPSSMARNILNHAALASHENKRDIAGEE